MEKSLIKNKSTNHVSKSIKGEDTGTLSCTVSKEVQQGAEHQYNVTALSEIGKLQCSSTPPLVKSSRLVCNPIPMTRESLERLGLRIGHYTDEKSLTGTTVFLAEKGADVGIDIRGSDPGSLNTPAFDPRATSNPAHGIILTGGSCYGLESAFGVMQYLEEMKIGEQNRTAIIPCVTGGVIYDLGVGSGTIRPTNENGYSAASNASFDDLRQGNIGVGIGATTGKLLRSKKLKGGFGMACIQMSYDILIGAFVVTNAAGDVVNPNTGEFYVDTGNYISSLQIEDTELQALNDISSRNTTLAVIATNISLERSQLIKVAELAHDGMARAIFPVHTMQDGDMIFATSSHSSERKIINHLHIPVLINMIGIGAGDALMRAIKNSILHAQGIEGYPSYSNSVKSEILAS